MDADTNHPKRPIADDFGRPKLQLLNSPLQMWFDRLDGREWDRIVAGFDGVCQEQLCVFCEARWPGTTLDPVIFYRGGRTLGGALVMYWSLPARLGGLAVVKWAPMLADRNSPRAGEDIQDMVEVLIQRYAIKKRLMLSVLPRALPAGNDAELEYLEARGFTAGPQMPFPNRYFVKIEGDEAEQRAAYARRWRNQLGKAENQDLVFDRYPASALPVFQQLYDATADRKRFADYSAVHTLPALMKSRVNAVRPELFLVSHDGAPVAGAVIFTAGDTAVYLYGASNDRAQEPKAGYFLHNRILNWLRENTGARWYDLGGTGGFEGLHRFKSGMAGKTGAISPVPPAMHYAHGFWPRLVGTSVYRAGDARSRVRGLFGRRRAVSG